MSHQSRLGSLSHILHGEGQDGTLLYRHPEYRRRWWWWEFYRTSYVGGRDYYDPPLITAGSWHHQHRHTSRNADGQIVPIDHVGDTVSPDHRRFTSLLFKGVREDWNAYVNRDQRAFYYNFVGPMTSALVAHAFKKPPTREGPQSLEDFWNAVDEKRSIGIDEWLRDITVWAQVYGIMWAVVDARSPVGASDGGANGGDGAPYVYMVPPLNVWDWHYDDAGELVWLKQFVYTERDRERWDDKYQGVFQFHIWDREKVEIWEHDETNAQGKLEDTRKHEFGKVPWVPLYTRKQPCADAGEADGLSRISDLSMIANNVFNLASRLNQIYEDQTFSQLVIPGNTQLDEVQLGTSRFLTYNNDGGGEVKFISPDADQARVMREQIGDEMMLARQAFGVGRGRQEGSMQQASADALELEGEDKRSILGDIVAEVQDFENRLAECVKSLSTRESAAEFSIIYPTDFDLRSLADDIEEATALKNLPVPPGSVTQMTKDIVRKKFSQMESGDVEALVAEVDEAAAEREKRAEEMQDRFAARTSNPDDDEGTERGGESADEGNGNGAESRENDQ